MPDEYENQEALQALDDSVLSLMQIQANLVDLSNSVGMILAHLDRDEANPEVQELLEASIGTVGTVVERLKGIVDEKTNEEEKE